MRITLILAAAFALLAWPLSSAAARPLARQRNTIQANAQATPAILCLPTPTPTATPTATRVPNGAPLDPAGVALQFVGGPRYYQEFSGEWRTLFDYQAIGGAQTQLRIWVSDLYNVAGWPDWARESDTSGQYIHLLPLDLSATGQAFSLAFNGRLSSAPVVWDAGPTAAGGIIASAAAAPRWQLYLPLVQR